MKLRILIYILSVAVRKHGGKQPVTLEHLLNILKMARRYELRLAESEELENQKLMDEIRGDGQF